MNTFEDPELNWIKIENDYKKPKKNKKQNNNSSESKLFLLYEKYNELNNRYSIEYGRSNGSLDCDILIDDLKAFERVFNVMRWPKNL